MESRTVAVRPCAAGGVHNGEYVSWLYCYDPIMDVWARKQDMNTKRAIHALAGMNDRLYAIGGNHLKGKRFLGSERPPVFFTAVRERHAETFTECSSWHLVVRRLTWERR